MTVSRAFPSTIFGVISRWQWIKICALILAMASILAAQVPVTCGGTASANTAAIQTVLDANTGTSIVFPDGVICTVNPNTLKLPAGTVLRGHGTIKVPDAFGPYDYVLASPDCTGCDIEEITIDGNVAKNPISNYAEIVAHPRNELFITGGQNINIQNITVKNSSAVNSVVVNGPGVQNVKITENNFTNMGDDPNHVIHDMSSVYTYAANVAVIGNTLTAAAISSPAGYTAIEVHGSNTTVSNNVIQNYINGVNLAGVWAAEVNNVSVTGNTITGAQLCVEMWSSAYGSHMSGYGLNGVEVANNTCRINQTAFMVPIWGSYHATWGITIDPNANLPVANVKIHDNSILFDLEDSVRTGDPISHGIGWYSVNNIAADHLLIKNNIIENAPVTGIRVSTGTITGLDVSGNTIRNAGSSLDSTISSNFKVPIFLWSSSSINGNVSYNHLLDDLDTSRTVYAFELGASAVGDLEILGNDVVLSGSTTSSWASYFHQEDDFVNPLVQMSVASKPWTMPARKMRGGSAVWDATVNELWNLPVDGRNWSATSALAGSSGGPYGLVPSTTSTAISTGSNDPVTLTLVSTNYTGTVALAVNSSSSDVTATLSAATVSLTSGGVQMVTLTIAPSVSAANYAPVLPWKSGGMMVFAALLAGVPFAPRQKKAMAVLLTALAVALAGFMLACGGGSISAPKIATKRTCNVTVTAMGSGAVTNPSPVVITVIVP